MSSWRKEKTDFIFLNSEYNGAFFWDVLDQGTIVYKITPINSDKGFIVF